jgi:hypothetical protein
MITDRSFTSGRARADNGDMRGILILLAALGLLAGEPALAAPSPPQDPPQRLSLRGLLYQLEQQADGVSSAAGR